ncbi:MAG TPA: phosphoglycerate mutase family protein [Saprospiraceae bacterium]|nr:phosphoglycerate mutase family protein [Saprospiraceae bacterium]
MRILGTALLFAAVIFTACKSEPAIVKVNNITDEKITLSNGEVIALPNDPGNGATTIFIVRHAEKEKNGDVNPHLSLDGKIRAKKIDSLFTSVNLSGILSTSYFRAMETLQPLSDRTGTTIMNYLPDSMDPVTKYVLEYEKGKKFLIVGHSNSIPGYVLSLVPNSTPFTIGEEEYDNLYVITADNAGNSKFYSLKY